MMVDNLHLIYRLKVNTEPMGFAPTFDLEQDCQHPLAVDQRNGISLDQVGEFVCRLMKQG